MKIQKALIFVWLVGLLLSACAQASLEPTSTTTGVVTSPAITQTAVTGQAGQTAVDASLASLSELLHINASQIKISAVEPVEWPNACLGNQKADEMCADVIMPGYRITLEAGGESYEFHTNLDGSQIRMVEAALPDGMSATSLPPAVKAARQSLIQQQRVLPEVVRVIRSEPVQWRDGCLGVERPGMMCTQVITPGYRVILEADGKQYEYHTNESGSTVISAGTPQDAAQEPKTFENIVIWQQTENNLCSQAEIGMQDVASGTCNGPLKQSTLGPDHTEELSYLVNTYRSFTQDTLAGTVDFTGKGHKEPTTAEMRSVAEWARTVSMEAQGGQSSANLGIAFTWHREGGFAGFCDDLTVGRAGWAAPTTCKIGQLREASKYRLTAGELEKMYTWLDLLASFDFEHKDAAVADAMLVRVSFKGMGRQEAVLTLREEVASYGSQLFANAVNK